MKSNEFNLIVSCFYCTKKKRETALTFPEIQYLTAYLFDKQQQQQQQQ